ncbi:NAD(P)H-binding protein [Paenibacillus sp. 32352]|uniref:NmrA family NAD(P)-binding protein n=1 Tax=Paenibacillus sp. 32352 TaxID=1969111 RepID=UPI0009AE0C39|nr:NAD(P)H-binding protein [Paenibacillus sp. 32352]
MSIVITGANGQLGSLVIQELLQRIDAKQIIACIRDAERGKSLEELGIELRYCDYDRPESLPAALRGAKQLLFISSSHQDDAVRLLQHERVIEAAKQAQVQHIAYTSFAYAEQGSISLTQLHVNTERAIAASGIPYTIFRNALYTDIVKVFGLDAAIASGELVVPPGEWTFNTVTREDLAAAIAAVLCEPLNQGRSYELTASQSWTMEDLSSAISELAGKTISVRRDAQMKHWVFGFLSQINTVSTSNDLQTVLGRPAISLKETLRQFVEDTKGI